MINMQLWLV